MTTNSGDGTVSTDSLLLNDNEALFRSLFLHAPVGSIIAGSDGKIVRANSAFCKFLRYTEKELRGLTFLDITHIDDRGESSQQLQGLMRGQRSAIEMERRFLRKDGEVVWVQVMASAVVGTDSLPVLLFAIVQDIASRRSTEFESRRVSHFVEKLVDSAQAIVLVLDTEGGIVRFNRYMEELSGYEIDEVCGENWFEIFAPSSETERRRFLFQACSDERSHRGNVTEILTRNGQARLIQWSAEQLREADGSVGGILAIGIDITRQRDAEGEARLEKERNRAILASAIDGIVTFGEEGSIESFNPSAEKMFGYRQQEIVGHDVGVLLPRFAHELRRRNSRQERGCDLKRLAGSGSEHRARHKDGTLFPIHLSLAAMEFADQGGYCGLIRNLSESKKVEDHLRQAQRLEAIGSLASGVAHDFNNLLMGVVGCATIALECADAGRSNRMYLAELLRSAESGKAIIQQLLAFSRKAEVVLEVFELDSVILANEDMLRRLLGEDVEVVVELQAGESHVRADVGQIEQVLMNLVVNARDAMPTGGRLVIKTSCVTLGGDSGPVLATGNDISEGEHISLTVTDDGVGMSAETRERLFEPFYTTKESGKGTGLGLAMVYGNVKQFGGDIQARSVAGGGTRLEILLPTIAGKQVAKQTPASVPAQAKKHGTILLCEDDRLVGMTIAYYLEGAGYRVLRAGSCSAAVEFCREFGSPIHLLLTDVVLPDQNGDKAAEEIRRLKPGIEVLYMSAHSAEWLESEGRVSSPLETLQKPMDKESLLARVAEVLEKHSQVPLLSPGPVPAPSPRATVLVVDDDDAVRLALSTSLATMGYEVLSAGDGSEAVEMARGFDGELAALVVDVVLPKIMGVAVAQEVEALHPGIGVIYMSGYPEEVAIQRELVGDALFVAKPATPETIHAMLAALRGNLPTSGTDSASHGSVLVVEDYSSARLAISDYLSIEGWSVVTASVGAEALALVREGVCVFDVLLVDYSLPDMKGDDLAKQVKCLHPNIAVAYMSGYAGLRLDPPGPLLTKPLDLAGLAAAIEALEKEARTS